MLSKFTFWKIVNTIIGINFIFFILEYLLYDFNYHFILEGIFLFTITAAISALFYSFIKYNQKLGMQYVDEEFITDETKNKILKEDKLKKINSYSEKKFLKELKKIIQVQLIIISIYEPILLITIYFQEDLNVILNTLILTLPAFAASIIYIYLLIKKILYK